MAVRFQGRIESSLLLKSSLWRNGGLFVNKDTHTRTHTQIEYKKGTNDFGSWPGIRCSLSTGSSLLVKLYWSIVTEGWITKCAWGVKNKHKHTVAVARDGGRN